MKVIVGSVRCSIYDATIRIYQEKYGFRLKGCHVADVLQSLGLTTLQSWIGDRQLERVEPCPLDRISQVRTVIRDLRAGKYATYTKPI